MSIEVIENQISHFLSSDTPEVMVIKGDWGVGKTFSWKKFLADAKGRNGIKLNKYSYVSLFGINSLESLKHSIAENVVERKLIGAETSINIFKDNTVSRTKSFVKRHIKFLKDLPIIKLFIPTVQEISFLSLSQTIICIDDLERKGNKLDIRDILGLVSSLKEQKKCKIILLLNDKEEGLEDYRRYLEKVVDVELSFSPSAEECAQIAYSNEVDYHSKLKELTINLGIRNIRILKKIERLVKLSLPIMKGCETDTEDKILHSIVLYSWSYYCSNSNSDIPPLDFIINIGYELFISNKKEISEEEKKWITILTRYNYRLTSDLDITLAKAVKTGFFIESELKEKIDFENKKIIAAKAENSFSSAWELYHDSFDNNTNEVISRLYDSLKNNCKHITPMNLNGTVTLFRELGENNKASEIIDIYIENRKDEVGLFNLREANVSGDIKDREIIDKFNECYNRSVIIESAGQVLARIANTNGWNPDDEVILVNTSVDDYYNLFKSEKGDRMRSFVFKCLNFDLPSNASEQQKEITNKAVEALKKIAAESEINKLRVQKFGIDI
ncbi:P-loop NTPase fold protein [Xenorhabdus sp. PB30.3]|uniref:P-loop NTPase fold protein n=1 Tax=Xenorhabdus sp. PB30.3 TaxID=2788941 RepID=UPI001E42F9CA|nr:P-loop NTPase fold protein [Xenorhabdus sp. PB30.3]MCC8381741.1 hypothetical protein [Xenorhabdus sp. PB30.3]